MPRLSRRSKTLANEICQLIADGLSIREIAKRDGMLDESNVYRWLVADEAFRDQYARAKELQAERFAEEIVEIADDGSNDWMTRKFGELEIEVPDHEHINRSRLRVDTRKWLMSKMLPKKYGDKLDVAHSGSLSFVDMVSSASAKSDSAGTKDD